MLARADPDERAVGANREWGDDRIVIPKLSARRQATTTPAAGSGRHACLRHRGPLTGRRFGGSGRHPTKKLGMVEVWRTSETQPPTLRRTAAPARGGVIGRPPPAGHLRGIAVTTGRDLPSLAVVGGAPRPMIRLHQSGHGGCETPSAEMRRLPVFSASAPARPPDGLPAKSAQGRAPRRCSSTSNTSSLGRALCGVSRPHRHG